MKSINPGIPSLYEVLQISPIPLNTDRYAEKLHIKIEKKTLAWTVVLYHKL